MERWRERDSSTDRLIEKNDVWIDRIAKKKKGRKKRR